MRFRSGASPPSPRRPERRSRSRAQHRSGHGAPATTGSADGRGLRGIRQSLPVVVADRWPSDVAQGIAQTLVGQDIDRAFAYLGQIDGQLEQILERLLFLVVRLEVHFERFLEALFPEDLDRTLTIAFQFIRRPAGWLKKLRRRRHPSQTRGEGERKLHQC
ncbi:MAG: hypothetical protein LC804_05340 [Acidobacteria bacterium]|nr:hypothetical protein [Acidobacteriota bacterium]